MRHLTIILILLAHALLGATFTNHPAPAPAVFDVVDRENIATRHLPLRWDWRDELYNFRDIQSDIHVILKVDETTYKGGQNGADHPRRGITNLTADAHFTRRWATLPKHIPILFTRNTY
jgi:hypothetical protein